MNQRTEDDIHLGDLMQRAQSGDADAYLRLLQDITPRVREIVSRVAAGEWLRTWRTWFRTFSCRFTPASFFQGV